MCGDAVGSEVVVEQMDEEGRFTLNQFRVLLFYMLQYGAVSPTFLAEIAPAEAHKGA